MATVACKCGEKFHPSPEHYGKEVRCRRCGRMVTLTPDPVFDAPPKKKSSGFTQSFSANAPPPSNAYRPPAPPPAAPVAPQPDPNAPPPGLHPDIRRILIYAFVVAALGGGALIYSAIKYAGPGTPATEDTRPPEER